jgi:ribosomal protein S18 acetylase RimI-like enzyme
MINFVDSTDINPQQLLSLYDQTDWARDRSLDDTTRMLAHTDVAISAWDGSTLVGFGRVLTDYVFRASIWDVIVDRAYQDRDIGKGIVHRILTHPHFERV